MLLACIMEELPPALANLSRRERLAVLVPAGFLSFADPALPLVGVGGGVVEVVRPASQYPGPSLPRCITTPQILSFIKDIHLYSRYLPSHTHTHTAAPWATGCQSLLSLSSSAHPLRTPGTVASRRLAFSNVGRSHQTFKQSLCATQHSSPRLGKSKTLATSLEVGGGRQEEQSN